MQRTSSGMPVPQNAVEVLVLANNCTDTTAENAWRVGCHLPFSLSVIERTLPDHSATAGGARRIVMDEAADRLRARHADGIILTTDADSTVSPTCARIVSGYLYNPYQESTGSNGAGSTHAWAEVYIPGAGWITFDPTNRGVGGFNLIPVAVGRNVRQIMPVVDSFVGMTNAFQGMSVQVKVSA
jgi:hypothetical protein